MDHDFFTSRRIYGIPHSKTNQGNQYRSPGHEKLTGGAIRAAPPEHPIPARTPTGNCAIDRLTND
jgi:hypothetical protein